MNSDLLTFISGEIVQKKGLLALIELSDVIQAYSPDERIVDCFTNKSKCGTNASKFFTREYENFMTKALYEKSNYDSNDGFLLKIRDMVLKSSFLQTILLREPFRSALPRKVVFTCLSASKFLLNVFRKADGPQAI